MKVCSNRNLVAFQDIGEKEAKEKKEIELKIQKYELNQKIINFISCNNIKNEVVNSDIGEFILYNLLIEYKLKNLGLNSINLYLYIK